MDIAGLINRLGDVRRDYAGTFYSVPSPSRPRPFRASFEPYRTDEAVCFEGGIKFDESSPPLSYRLTIPFAKVHMLGGRTELACSAFGRLEGDFLSTGTGFSFLALEGVAGASFTASFEATGPSFSVSGIVRQYSQSLAFHATPASQWERSLQARVYQFPE